jgi:hypothetical protein
MNGTEVFLGVVMGGKFHQLEPAPRFPGDRRFTSMPVQESVPPESRELNFHEYEGSVIMIRGRNNGGWVYSAEVVDKAGPILTAVVQRIFGQTSQTPPAKLVA